MLKTVEKRPRAEPIVDKEVRATPIDMHVGSRVKLRRTLLGMSQEKLGHALGLTFQQIQKYERGVNRIGASRLFDLARELDVPIGFFFDDLPSDIEMRTSKANPFSSGFGEPQEVLENEKNRKETVDLVRAFLRISEPAVRKRIIDLVKSLAPPD